MTANDWFLRFVAAGYSVTESMLAATLYGEEDGKEVQKTETKDVQTHDA